MKLSDLKSSEIQAIDVPAEPLKLSGIHPDEIESVAEPESDPSTSPVTAATTGFFSGVPFAKQIGAGAKTALDVATGITPLSGAAEEYNSEKNALTKDFSTAEKAHPVISGVASLAGATALNPALEAAAETKVAAPLVKTLGKVGTQGAIYGAADAASQADSEGGSVSDIVAKTLKGGALGGIIGKGVGKLGEFAEPYLERAGSRFGALADAAVDSAGKAQDTASEGTSKLMTWARKNALRSLNPTTGDIENLGVQGQDKMGQYLLEYGLADNSHMEEKLAKVNKTLETNGSKIGDTVKKLDDEGAQAFNSSEISDHVENTYADIYKDTPAYNWVLQQIKKFTPQDGGNLSFADSFKLKKLLTAKAYSMRGDPSQIGNVQLLRNVGNDITSAYKQAAAEYLSPADYKQFIKANNDYSFGLNAQDILEGAQAKELKGTGTSGLSHALKLEVPGGVPGALVAGTAAAALGHPLVGAGLVAKSLNKPGFKAPVQNALANAGDAVSSVLQKTPSYFGKYSAPLQAAIQRGPTSFAVTHNLLQQSDPEYREKVRKLQEQGKL